METLAVGSHYNGYNWKQRLAITEEKKNLEKKDVDGALNYLHNAKACDICSDPNEKLEWHSEDYSMPFVFHPPATFKICACCHLRIHKRFNQPAEWIAYTEHIQRGGHGREFVKLHKVSQRKAWIDKIFKGEPIQVPTLRRRELTGKEWWLNLTLDPESLLAPWARPRPLTQYPTANEYGDALSKISLSAQELAILRTHAQCRNRTATMRALAVEIFGANNPEVATALYISICQRLAPALNSGISFQDKKSQLWVTTVAEGWQPKDREFEWVMVPTFYTALLNQNVKWAMDRSVSIPIVNNQLCNRLQNLSISCAFPEFSQFWFQTHHDSDSKLVLNSTPTPQTRAPQTR